MLDEYGRTWQPLGDGDGEPHTSTIVEIDLTFRYHGPHTQLDAIKAAFDLAARAGGEITQVRSWEPKLPPEIVTGHEPAVPDADPFAGIDLGEISP